MMTPQISLLGLPREIRDIILQYAIPHRELTFGHTNLQRDAPTRFHGFDWDVLAPRSLQNDACATASLLEPFNNHVHRLTLRDPCTSEIMSPSKNTGLNLLLTCRQLQAEAAEILYSGECTLFRFWSIFALMSFLDCVGDNATFLRQAFLRVELTWTSQLDVNQYRTDMQYLLRQAAQRLTSLRSLELLVSLDPFQCVPGYWSERSSEDENACIGLQEMFGPLKQIMNLDQVTVDIHSRDRFSTPDASAEFSKVKDELKDGLRRYLDRNHPPRVSPATLEGDARQEKQLLIRTGSAHTFILEENDAAWMCCAPQ